MTLKINALLLFLAFPFFSLSAKVYYVSPAPSGNGSGETWADATTLQTAMEQAVAGDEIWITQGVYIPFATDPNVLSSQTALTAPKRYAHSAYRNYTKPSSMATWAFPAAFTTTPITW